MTLVTLRSKWLLQQIKFYYDNYFKTIKPAPGNVILKLKSIHFKKIAARSLFLSKLWYLLLYWKVPQFWKKWGSRNCLLKIRILNLVESNVVRIQNFVCRECYILCSSFLEKATLTAAFWFFDCNFKF